MGAVVGDDHVHDPIPVYNLLVELDCHLRASCSYRLGLNLLGELVDHDKQVIEALEGGREFPNKVKSPDGKGPCDQDRLEFLRGDVFLLGKVLTSLASPQDVLCILNRGGLVKPISKGFTHQGVRCCNVPTSPQVYILQEFYPIFLWVSTIARFRSCFYDGFHHPS